MPITDLEPFPGLRQISLSFRCLGVPGERTYLRNLSCRPSCFHQGMDEIPYKAPMDRKPYMGHDRRGFSAHSPCCCSLFIPCPFGQGEKKCGARGARAMPGKTHGR
jgi:hypothetical protein